MQYTLELIGYITTFENISRAKVKEAFYDLNNILTFIVEPGEIGKALGKKGNTIKRLAMLIKKRLRVIEYDNDLQQFIKNCILPHLPKNIRQEGEMVIIETTDSPQKSALYGREKNNLKNLQFIIQKYFKATIKIQ